MPHLTRKRLGKRPAVIDPRIPKMGSRMNSVMLKPPPSSANWYADLPDSGVALLGNDTLSCCVEASVAHYLSSLSLYTTPHKPIVPTEAEVVTIYSAVTGYNPQDPSTDQGSFFLGPQGMVQYWLEHGVTVGGVLNRPTAVASVDIHNRVQLKQAVALFGFVFVGATMRQDDVDSEFMWSVGKSAEVGGHEFLLCGYQTVGHVDYYDVMTWNGMWRCADGWITQAVDEACVVLDRSFFDTTGKNPGGIMWDELARDMAAFG